MSPLSATAGSVLTLIAETPDLTEDRFQALIELVDEPFVTAVAHVLRSRDWQTCEYPADAVEFARAIYERAEQRRLAPRERPAVAVR